MYMCMNEHTYTHVHTHSTTCSDFGFLFLTLSLFSQSVHVHECSTLNCYVNSLYTIFVPHTHTHTPHSCTHTHARTTCSDINWVLIFRLFSQSVHVHECTHLCTHIVMYTACTPYICHTYSTYTQYSCIVTEMESCAQHIHTLMYSTLVRTHTNEKH